MQDTLRLLKQVHDIAALPNGGGMRWLTSPESRLQCARTLVQMLRTPLQAFRSPADRLEIQQLVHAVFDEVGGVCVCVRSLGVCPVPAASACLWIVCAPTEIGDLCGSEVGRQKSIVCVRVWTCACVVLCGRKPCCACACAWLCS